MRSERAKHLEQVEIIEGRELMQTKGQMFRGCTVALVTPFRDGSVDEAALRNLVDWHMEQGTPVISPVGTTGESPTLSHLEHERVISLVVEQAAGRAKVLAGTGSNATSEAVRLTRFAERAGADGALLVAPYYNRPSQEGLYAHYSRIAEETDLPLMLYNVPGRTARNIEPETVERLARIARVVAIKEASGSLDQVSELRSRTELTILSGDDSLTLPMLAVGAEGVVSVVANLVPRDVMALIEAFEQGDLQAARQRHLALFPLCRDLLSIAANPIPVKTAMALLGRDSGELRLPLCPPDDRGREALLQSLIRHGLLPGTAR
ncbi:4-hydroxy-tetrahydrodipicolinate synthase [soil metagenome]